MVSAGMGRRFQQEEGVQLVGASKLRQLAKCIPNVENEHRGIPLTGKRGVNKLGARLMNCFFSELVA
jgi:hypothetical protein